uniref:glutathione binding-like protein n=1 Tax=Geminicoccus flavidas TaxID=2506407 RepID=UPI001F2910ED
YIAGEYSIADMASYPWIVPYENQGQNLEDFPHLQRWFNKIKARPATERAYAHGPRVNPEVGKPMGEEEKKILFGQTHKR